MSRYGGSQFPSQDVPREVIQHTREIVPTPVLDFEAGELRLPELMYTLGGMLVHLYYTHHPESRTFHQVKTLENAVCAGFRQE